MGERKIIQKGKIPNSNRNIHEQNKKKIKDPDQQFTFKSKHLLDGWEIDLM